MISLRTAVVATLIILLSAADGAAWVQRFVDDTTEHFDPKDVAVDGSGDTIVVGTRETPVRWEFLVTKLSGATGSEIWRAALGDPTGGNVARVVTVDSAGDVVAGGSFATPPFSSQDELAVVKLDGSSGAELWTHVITETGMSLFKDLAVDASDDVIGSGRNGGVFSVFKLGGATGAEIWRTDIDTFFGNQSANAIAIDAAGDVFAVGHVRDISLEEVLFVAKLDGSTGAVLWSVQEPVLDSTAEAVALDAGGDVIVGGQTSAEAVVIKFDGASGAELWRHSTPTPYLGTAAAVAVDPAGDVLSAGRTNVIAFHGSDLLVTKIDGATGAQLWQVMYDGTDVDSFDAARGIEVEASGDVVVGGEVDYDTTGRLVTLLRLDGATGAEVWSQSIDGTEAGGSLRALDLDPSGNAVVAGVWSDKKRSHRFAAFKADGADGSIAAIDGTKLAFRDGGESLKRRITFLLSGDLVQSPPPATDHDPRTAGATVRIWNPTTLEEATFSLPAGASWTAVGGPPGVKGYKYRDITGAGPCTRLAVRPNKKLKVSCSGKTGNIPFTLDEPTQGSLAVSVQFGGAAPQCAVFGGDIPKDEPGQFKGRRADPAAACP